MDLQRSLGFHLNCRAEQGHDEKVLQYINLKLAAMGQPIYGSVEDSAFLEIARPLIDKYQQNKRQLTNWLSPVDQRIQSFIDDYLKDVDPGTSARLPLDTFVLDRHGLARILSLPPERDTFSSEIIQSYRLKQGILHNPRSDRRTTQGVFHIVEGGMPIPNDKVAVPKVAFKRLLAAAMASTDELMRLPFTSSQENQARLFVSLLLRPVVCPEVPGFTPEKSLEIRFFAPGGLVSNLDFVESIFGNAGAPYLPENDAALDPEHWTGHTGCVILAPHLVRLRKKDLGLPHAKDATARQKRDGMCWEKEDELYNGGQAFKVACRDERGVMVTVIADNYFGYCKKEVKTQISYSANLYGLAEEEHSGGALAFPNYDLGRQFQLESNHSQNDMTFAELVRLYGPIMDLKPEGYGVDKQYPDILYVPEDARFDLRLQTVSWTQNGAPRSIRLVPTYTFVLPSGYKIRMKKQTGGPTWHLFGTVADGTLCHKPSTVSGGGKSEISKSIVDAMIQGPIFTADFHADMVKVAEIINRKYGNQFKPGAEAAGADRPLLSAARSLGSVIKLLTPSSEYTDEYNAWLQTFPPHIREMVFIVKRFYRSDWGDAWAEHFSVDIVNGRPGHELKFQDKKLVANYLRVGQEKDGAWRIYKVRGDFSAAEKLQFEDDITASVVVPRDALQGLNAGQKNPSVKIVKNCEYRLFQRPDDAVIRGYDKQAEADLSAPENFLSNWEPLTQKNAQDLVEDAVGFDQYTEPMKKLLSDFAATGKPSYAVSSAHPRMVDGKPSKNPRYLQNRPDVLNPKQRYLAETGARFFRKIPLGAPVHFPVNAVLAGRRCNPPDVKAGIPPLACYSPIHYQELPELFMDFICSVTGKSPSTTGFGSEGALTKGPFNALLPIIDLNNALVSYILTGYAGFSTAAGHIGPQLRVDHDISLLVPEIWSRMSVQEREPEHLVRNGFLEKLEDFEHKGRKIPASLLGYRITDRFARAYLGRIFTNPENVFSEEMLRPEKQDADVFAESVQTLAETYRDVARNYFEDGGVEAACPPLKALLHLMAEGSYEGKGRNHPDIRALFTREALLQSAWYRERLAVKQNRDVKILEQHLRYLEQFLARPGHPAALVRTAQERRDRIRALLDAAKSPAYLKGLDGTIGADPLRAVSAASPAPAVR